MAMMNLINVNKSYGQHCILDNINLTIDKGEFVVVVGPSGCGKSTLLRLVSGLEAVTSGSILLNNTCINQIPPAQRDIAMVFQTYALYPHMSVFENMAYGLKMRRMPTAIIKSRVHEVASLLQMSAYLHRKPAALSGGQRQRVAMGRAIVRSPAVFLFDEPLSNLDTKLRTEMRYEIKKLHQQLQSTCLYVTHDQTEAMTMAARVLVLNQGRIEQIGSPQLLYTQPASLFVASLTGHYPINFLNATINLKLRKVITNLGFALPLPTLNTNVSCGTQVIIGIRPEHLNVVSQKHDNIILVQVEFVDNMGADKLVQAITICGRERFAIRVPADLAITDGQLALEIVVNKANLFHKETGLRLGGWHE